MRNFDGRTAVITGGASGIGLGVARALAAEGANLVLADMQADRLDQVVADLSSGAMAEGRRAIGVVTDVRDLAAVQRLADRAYDEFGVVHVVHNNAGVFVGGRTWEATDDDWEWLWGVNVRGLINGIRAFVPRMLDVGEEGHVINTASMAGITASPMAAAYCTTKFAAVGLSEALHHDLAMVEGCRIGVSVVCPSIVSTDITDNSRHRPGDLADAFDGESAVATVHAISAAMESPSSLPADVAGRRIVDEVKAGHFFVATHDSFGRLVANHDEDRLQQRAPRFQFYD